MDDELMYNPQIGYTKLTLKIIGGKKWIMNQSIKSVEF